MQLSREAIVQAALDILNTYGFADVTMRRVANQLSVAPGALYWHIANKQELIQAMAQSIVSGAVAEPADTRPLELATQFRECLLRYRDGAEVVAAAMAQPHSPSLRSLQSSFTVALEHYAKGRDIEDHDLRAAAHGILNAILGATLIEQSAQQFAELSGLEIDDTNAGTTLRSAALILRGLTRHPG